jgi:CRISPR-associated protein Csd1
MEILPGVADTRDPAYNCGRLLAVFDNLQRRAHRADNPGAKLNTTIAERYFASASSAPATAFAVLWRLHQHHLKKLRQNGKEGATKGFGCRIGEICARFDKQRPDGAPEFPRVLTLVEQGRFALGFYQEQVASCEAARKWFEVHGRKGNDDPDIADVGEDTNETDATT